MQEHIQFEFGFLAEYWDLPPMIDISINNVLVWTGPVGSKNARVLVEHTLDYNQEHLLAIRRYNKTDNQCVILNDGTCKDQHLIIKQVIIDNIDIQNLVWHRSWYEPEYPLAWKQEQELQGVVLESHVPGETWFGHNGTWYFQFTSPFYQYVINQFR